jgi:glycerol-3-phosphate acyltransferase PlsY
MINVLFVLVAYLLGSIPFSYLLGILIKGQDIRQLGSGNLGATNAFRVFGKPVGMTVAILDTLKSGLLVFLIKDTSLFSSFDLWNPLIFGFASVLGHCFPVWFRFKGGKGVATSFGLILAYNPWIGLVIFSVFLICEIVTRYVSVSSTIASLSMFLLAVILHFAWHEDIALVIITFLAVSVIIYRHQTNYKRLKLGTENKVKWLDPLDNFFQKRK